MGMRNILRVFPVGHFAISLLFIVASLALIVFAALSFWEAVAPSGPAEMSVRMNAVLEGIAILTIAVASLELGQTLIEEEVVREAHMSAPTRVRRFLSRFMTVLVVSLSIETLVAVFRYSRDAPDQLPYAAAVGITAAALLAAWGVFIKLNRSAEELEPEAMEAAKREDAKMG